MQSFKNIKKKNTTELSKTFWNPKESGLNPTINWKIIKLSPKNQDKNAATCA